ncbi:MAG: sigma-70 family RNA polymerase sigma factor [Acidimicrobiia bacterium]|nr:sigma-70 family RNA polymerase sigma factor [Acidimicrobiia bacterium]
MSVDFSTFYAAERHRLVRGLSLALGDDALANEAIDEAFTRALHRWHVVGTFDEPQAWVYRTAKNWATSRFRRRSRDRRFAPKIATPEASVDPTPDPQLADALKRLPEDQRNVLVLRYYLDWTIEAVAEALDVSAGTVKSRTNRALSELNRLLGERT